MVDLMERRVHVALLMPFIYPGGPYSVEDITVSLATGHSAGIA